MTVYYFRAAMPEHTAISANIKNNRSLFQNARAAARHSKASCDRGSSDQSNIFGKSL